MSIESLISMFIVCVFIIKVSKERYKLYHPWFTTSFFNNFKNDELEESDITKLRIAFLLPFIPFSMYKSMSHPCRELYKLGRNNNATTKKLIIIYLQLHYELKNSHAFLIPKTKKQLFTHVYRLVKNCEDKNIKIKKAFLGNEDIYEVMAELAKEI